MPTAIQTLKWRGFGFDRGEGFVELRFGVIGFAFTRQSLWAEVQDLRAKNAELSATNNDLIVAYKNMRRRIICVQTAVDMGQNLSVSINGEAVE
ncbi:MAG: hypothetical protein ABF968_04945 [Acetobacter sp.]|uniref:hypothetical protein n=1 Tax=Acetobacter sp. TaxID=440 RepID=UPI0039EC2019